MSKVSELRDRVYRMLSNPEQDAYNIELFIDGLSAALDAILPWYPKTGIEELVGDGGNIYDLPEGYYQIESCISQANGQLLPRASLFPDLYRGDYAQGPNNWIEFPHGSITFSKKLPVGEIYEIYYLAHWSKPTSSDMNSKELETPKYLDHALALYTTAQMLLPSAVSAAEVRQFNTRVDSGHPEHNPMQQSTLYLLRLFTDEMNKHPRYQKAQK